MAIRDRKVHKKRGHRTCGWGGAQKHRGAGHRGGRGMAGTSKHKWVWVSKFKPDYFLSTGFKRPKSLVRRDIIINIGVINEKINELSLAGIAKEDNGKFNINLDELGYDKLLGGGVVNVPLIITVNSCSSAARKKVADAGGEVLAPGGKETGAEVAVDDVKEEITESAEEVFESANDGNKS